MPSAHLAVQVTVPTRDWNKSHIVFTLANVSTNACFRSMFTRASNLWLSGCLTPNVYSVFSTLSEFFRHFKQNEYQHYIMKEMKRSESGFSVKFLDIASIVRYNADYYDNCFEYTY